MTDTLPRRWRALIWRPTFHNVAARLAVSVAACAFVLGFGPALASVQEQTHSVGDTTVFSTLAFPGHVADMNGRILRLHIGQQTPTFDVFSTPPPPFNTSPLFDSPWGLAFLGDSLLVSNADINPVESPNRWIISKIFVGEPGLTLNRPMTDSDDPDGGDLFNPFDLSDS